MKKVFGWILLALVLVVTIGYSHLPIPYSLDFQALYHANLGVLRGVPYYDWTGQVNMIADMAGVTPLQVALNPFAYPPWYSFITLPLAMLPIQMAARLWFAINFLIVLIFVWLATVEKPVRDRILFLLLTILFLPIPGTLIVGQFVFPVLLGAGLLLFALPRERVWLTSLGLFLLTFKPHMGGLVFLAISVFLFLRCDVFAKRVFWHTCAIMAFFFISGFLVDWNWPVHYLEKLFVFREVSQCEDLCISIPMMILSLFGVSSAKAIWVAGVLFVGVSGWFIRSRPKVWKDARMLIAVGFCITLLSSPYQYNYDFVVLLLPLFVLASIVRNMRDWLLLAFAYFPPWVGLFFERQGNQVLLVSAFGLLYLLWNKSGGNQSPGDFVSLNRDTK